jgi:hypothetical protein
MNTLCIPTGSTLIHAPPPLHEDCTKLYRIVRFEVLTAMAMKSSVRFEVPAVVIKKISVLWHIMHWSACYLLHVGLLSGYSSILKVEAKYSSEMSVGFQRTTLHPIYRIVHGKRVRNFHGVKYHYNVCNFNLNYFLIIYVTLSKQKRPFDRWNLRSPWNQKV